MLKKYSIDCLLNYNNNVLCDELEKYKDCNPVDINTIPTEAEKKRQCPMSCDFEKCGYRCYSTRIYYNEKLGIYESSKSN